MAQKVSELERLAGIVMAIERISFAEALLRVAERYPLLRDAAMRAHRQSRPTFRGSGESSREEE